MRVFQRFLDVRAALGAERAAGRRIGFVPTMGNLHDGHLELVKLARRNCDVVVVSIFVNPLQFALNEDWSQYPRTLEEDMARLVEAGVDYLFCPEEQEMYPNGMKTQTVVEVPVMTDVLCGASRPGHFRGVTTVVSKLFNIVQPDEAVFGLKDYQQLAVIRRMVEDLCIPITITPAPIARAEDGLALSSRNGYLTPEERAVAPQIYRSLSWAEQQIRAGRRDFAEIEEEAQRQIEQAGFRRDYFSVRQAKTLDEARPYDSDIVILAAAFLGRARLIDNVRVTLAGEAH